MADKPANPIRVGIAGCGTISRRIHLPNLRTMAGVRVVAMADPDRNARTSAAAIAPGADSEADWRTLIERDDLDAVIIALPTALHADAAAAALTAGLHVYIEKPLASTLAEATRIRMAADASPHATVMVGLNYRFNKLYSDLHATIDAGRIGEIMSVRSVFSTLAQPGDWRADPDNGGGVLLDLATHHIDLVTWLTRRSITRVMATVSDVRWRADTAALQMELEGGAAAQCYFTLSGPEADTMEVAGSAGTARISRYDSLAVELRGRDASSARPDQLRDVGRSIRNLPHLWRKLRAAGNEPSWGIALNTFIQAIRNETKDYPGLADGERALAVTDAAMASALTGCARLLARDTPVTHGLGENVV